MAEEFIGLDRCEANEGFNSNLDYFGKINCRVFVDDTEMRLPEAEYYGMTSEEETEEPIEGGEEEQNPESPVEGEGSEEVPSESEEENPEAPEGN